MVGRGLTAGPLALDGFLGSRNPALQAGLGKLPGLCPCILSVRCSCELLIALPSDAPACAAV